MVQSEINELVNTTVEVVVTHAEDMVCRVIGTLLFDSFNGFRVESRSLVRLPGNYGLRTNYIWLVPSKSQIKTREEIPLIHYNI